MIDERRVAWHLALAMSGFAVQAQGLHAMRGPARVASRAGRAVRTQV
jgi:hypothetical protein